MRRLILAMMLMAPFAPAAASPPPQCHADRILGIDASGSYIRIGAGWRLRVFPGQAPTATTWAPGDKLNVCIVGGANVSVTDLSQRGAAVSATRLF